MTSLNDAFKEQVGFDLYDLFGHPKSDTTLVHAYPISTGRFVTVSYEPYAILKWGKESAFHIRVWADCKLDQTAFVDVKTIFEEPDYERLHKSGEYEFIEADADWIYIGTYRLDEDGDYYDVWQVIITHDELEFLRSKMEPIMRYNPPEEGNQ